MTQDKKPTVEELMKLLARLTGWSNDTMVVPMAYMPTERGSRDDWVYVVSVQICGTGDKVRGEGKTLEEALHKLVYSVAHKLDDMRRGYAGRLERVSKLLEEAREDRLP